MESYTSKRVLASVLLLSRPFLLQNTVDKLLGQTGTSFAVGTSSWREQFIEALTVSAGMSVQDLVGLYFLHSIDGLAKYFQHNAVSLV